jgi:hypothetical protein
MVAVLIWTIISSRVLDTSFQQQRQYYMLTIRSVKNALPLLIRSHHLMQSHINLI